MNCEFPWQTDSDAKTSAMLWRHHDSFSNKTYDI